MLLLLILIIFFLRPIKVELTGKLHNLEFTGCCTVVFLGFLPLRIGIFNMKDIPWNFKAVIFGRTKDINFFASKLKRWRERNQSKGRRKKQDKRVLNNLRSLLKYIYRFEIIGKIGIKDRADTTALIVGWLNGTVYPMAVLHGIKKVKVYFLPEYAMNVADVKWECIFYITPANIIHEGIRLYLQRRK